MTELEQAAEDWSKYICINNLPIRKAGLGVFFIGMSADDLKSVLGRMCSYPLQEMRDAQDHSCLNYWSGNQMVLSVAIRHKVVTKIWCKGLLDSVPADMFYKVGKKIFLTHYRIDGYMLSVRDDFEELALRKESRVKAVDYDVNAQTNMSKYNLFVGRSGSNVQSSNSDVVQTDSGVVNYDAIAVEYKTVSERAIYLQQQSEALRADMYAKYNYLQQFKEIVATPKQEHGSRYFLEYTREKSKFLKEIIRLEKCGKLYEDVDVVHLVKDSDKSTAGHPDEDYRIAVRIVKTLEPFRVRYDCAVNELSPLVSKCDEMEEV